MLNIGMVKDGCLGILWNVVPSCRLIVLLIIGWINNTIWDVVFRVIILCVLYNSWISHILFITIFSESQIWSCMKIFSNILNLDLFCQPDY